MKEKIAALFQRSASLRKWITGVLIVIILAAVLVMTIPRLMGLKVFAITAPQDQSSLPQGTLLFVRPVRFEEIAVGDVAAFRPAKRTGNRFAQRITAVDPQTKTFMTEGGTQPVAALQLAGRVELAIPAAGYLAVLLEDNRWVIVLAVAVACWVAIEIELGRIKYKKLLEEYKTGQTEAEGQRE